MKGKYRKGIFIVVYRNINNKIEYLLLKRKLHWMGWEFCKGGCKAGEDMKKCVIREVQEETGCKPISIKKHNKSGKYKYAQKLADREGIIGQTYSLYSAKIKANKAIRVSKEEHSGYKWVNAQKAVKMLKWPNQRACLRLVSKELK